MTPREERVRLSEQGALPKFPVGTEVLREFVDVEGIVSVHRVASLATGRDTGACNMVT